MWSLATMSTVARAVASGAIFGFALEKSKVYLPSIIFQQMHFENFIMMEVFLTATAAGMGVMILAESLGLFTRSPKKDVALGFGLMHKYGGNIVGGALVGFGMTLAGACPGTVIIQLATGVSSAGPVLLGTVIGAATFGPLHAFLTRSIRNFGSERTTSTLDAGSRLTYAAIFVGVGAALAVALPALDSLHPWNDVLSSALKVPIHATPQFSLNNGTMVPVAAAMSAIDPRAVAWSPVASGMMIGVAQLGSLLLSASALGASGVYPYIGHLIISALHPRGEWRTRYPFYEKHTSPSPMFFAVGMAVGAASSVALSGLAVSASIDAAADLPGPLRAVLGGVLLVWGSRLAGGCTSGHGISGMAALAASSFVTVGAMFAGAMGLALFI